ASPYRCSLSLHDALPIFHDREAVGLAHRIGEAPVIRGLVADGELWRHCPVGAARHRDQVELGCRGIVAGEVAVVTFKGLPAHAQDRKSTRLNSSHVKISY